MTFAAGSIVVLKSGGPAMTVISTSGDDVECVWIGDLGELFRHAIPAIALESALDEDDIEDEDDDFEDDEAAEDDDEAAKKDKALAD